MMIQWGSKERREEEEEEQEQGGFENLPVRFFHFYCTKKKDFKSFSLQNNNNKQINKPQ